MKENTRWSTKKVLRKKYICAHCGILFNDREKAKRKYCSIKCQALENKPRIMSPEVNILKDLYQKQKLSTTDIAEKYGVSNGSAHRWLLRNKIKIRSVGEGVGIAQTGIKHTREWNEAISRGQNNMSFENRRKKTMAILKCNRSYANRSHGGIRQDLGIYLRSSWEANTARYLNFLKSRGEIKEWQYEPDTFEFIKIKRGTRFYTPDFKIEEKNGSIVYWEVKGYFDDKSKVRMKRMQKYYPNIKIILIGKDEYKAISKWSRLILGWEG